MTKQIITAGIEAKLKATLTAAIGDKMSWDALEVHTQVSDALGREIAQLSIKMKKTREEFAAMGIAQGAWNVLGQFDAFSAPITFSTWVESFMASGEQ